MIVELVDITYQYDHEGIDTLLFDVFSPSLNRFVGRVEFRDESGRDLLFYGNIGYVVYPPYRGHGFAYQACLEIFKQIALKRPYVKEVLITCNPDNIPSQKTIQKLGATYEKTVAVDSDHEIYKQGEALKEVYRLDLTNYS